MVDAAASAPNAPSQLEVATSRYFSQWLQQQHISLAFTTYQTHRLGLVGLKSEGRLGIFERLLDRPMGLYTADHSLYLSTRYQLWRFENVLSPGQWEQGGDRLYVPRVGHTTGDLDIHDVVLDASGQLIFVNTLHGCLATLDDRHSFRPWWKPPFISRLAAEDRCHLNGLALKDGQPAYVTAVSQSDVADGWREKRRDGGCVVSVADNEVVAGGLSMPHSPRWYRDRLWLLNSGRGELGYVDLDQGSFQPVTFCPGYPRGLAFWDRYAIVGISKPRDQTFSGLDLDDLLMEKGAIARCGLLIVDLDSGDIVHWLRLEGVVTELYDVQVIAGAQRPRALGFKNDEIAQKITFNPEVLAAASATPTATAAPVPAAAQAHFQQARRLKRQGHLDEAAHHLRQAIAHHPDYAAAHNNLGTLLQTQGHLDEAAVHYQAALRLHPTLAETHSNLASIWQTQGDWVAAEAGLRRALQLKPNYVPALSNLGSLLKDQGYLDSALALFQRVLQQQPDKLDAYRAQGDILETQGELEAALAAYQRALDLDPDNTEFRVLSHRVRLKMCDWRDYDASIAEIEQQVTAYIQGRDRLSLGIYNLNFVPIDPALYRQAAETLATRLEQSVAAAKARCQFPPPVASGRLRIGYLSPDLRNHAVGRLMQDVFAAHDRQQVEVFAYSLVNIEDGVSQAIAAGCDRFVNCAQLSPEATARRIHADGIHILVDLAGYTLYARPEILALQPAPVQAQMMGYPNTMGAAFVPYLLADPWLVPDALRPHYTETVIHLPHAFVTSPMTIGPQTQTRSQAGLPENGLVFCCFNRHTKIEPRVFQAWMEILRQVPDSVLWLNAAPAITWDNLRREAQQRGIEPDRLVPAAYLDRPDYLARHQLADLFLDTFVYAAGSTGVAALYSGLPLLTCTGDTNASRLGASLCAAAGLHSLICNSPDAYVQKAVHLAQHREELRSLRQHLSANRDTFPLFDPAAFARSLEEAYRQMWTEAEST